MTQHHVAADDFVFTRRGPALARDLTRNSEILVLDSKGVMMFSELTSLDCRPAMPAARVMTEVGEVIVFDGMCLLGRTGPLGGSAMRQALAKDQEIQLEVIPPKSIPAAAPTKVTRGALASSVLAMFTNGQFAIPTQISQSSRLRRGLSQLFTDAGIDVKRCEDERWTAFCFKPPKNHGPVLRGNAYRFTQLNAVTAWEEDGSRYLSRTVDSARALRAELLLAGVSAGLQPHVSWTPGYYPVDARIRFSDSSPAAFVKVIAIRDEMHEVCVVDVQASRQIVVAMHMLMPLRKSMNG